MKKGLKLPKNVFWKLNQKPEKQTASCGHSENEGKYFGAQCYNIQWGPVLNIQWGPVLQRHGNIT